MVEEWHFSLATYKYQTFLKIFQKHLDNLLLLCYNKSVGYLGVAQLVARYLGVVEAASSSLVTQTSRSIPLEYSGIFFSSFSLPFHPKQVKRGKLLMLAPHTMPFW